MLSSSSKRTCAANPGGLGQRSVVSLDTGHFRERADGAVSRVQLWWVENKVHVREGQDCRQNRGVRETFLI